MRQLQILLLIIFSFTTILALDIWESFPPDGASHLSAQQEIYVRSWPPIDTATVAAGVTINGSIHGNYEFQPVPGPNGYELRFVPTSLFEAGETITVTLTTAVATTQEWGGEHLSGEYTFSFGISNAAVGVPEKWDAVWRINDLVEYSHTSVADHNADGNLDLIATTRNIYDVAFVKVFEGGGHGVFQEIQSFQFPAGDNPSNISHGDIDGDGNIDFLVMNQNASTITIYQNDGLGHFAEHQVINTGFQQIYEGYFVDIDNDEDLDIAFSTETSQSAEILAIYVNDGNGNFSSEQSVPGTGYVRGSLAYGDMDNNGFIDFIGSEVIWLNQGSLSFTTLDVAFQGASHNQDIALLDLDGNDTLELVTCSGSPEEIHIYRGGYSESGQDSTGNQDSTIVADSTGFSLVQSIPVGSYPGSIASVDNDNDGDLDLLISITNKQQIYYIENHGGYFQDYVISIIPVQSSVRFLSVGDVDADGDNDLISSVLLKSVSSMVGEPTNVTIDTVINGLLISWTAGPGDQPQGYSIYRRSNNEQFKYLIDVVGTTSFLDSTLIPGYSYTYGISALDLNNNEGSIATVSGIRAPLPVQELFTIVGDSGVVEAGVTILDQNSMYAPISGDRIYRFNANGDIEYTLQVNGSIKSSTTITNTHQLYIASTDFNLYSFNSGGVSNSGWPVAMGSQVTASVAISQDGLVYIGTENGIYQCINPDGSIEWSYNVGGAVRASSIITPERTLLVINENGRAYGFNLGALDPSNVSYVWRLELNESVSATPAIAADGSIIICTLAGGVFRLIESDGSISELWNISIDEPIYSSPVIDPMGRAIVMGSSGSTYAIDVDSGVIQWEKQIGTGCKSTPALSEGYIYVGNDDGFLYKLSLENGNVEWAYPVGKPIICPIAVDEGKVYFGTAWVSEDYVDGTPQIYALNDAEASNLGKRSNNIGSWSTFQGNNRRTGDALDTYVGTLEEPAIPKEFKVFQNYPNPFNPETIIRYELPNPQDVEISIFSIDGRTIATYQQKNRSASIHEFKWAGQDEAGMRVSTGLYFARIQAGDYSKVIKMMYLK